MQLVRLFVPLTPFLVGCSQKDGDFTVEMPASKGADLSSSNAEQIILVVTLEANAKGELTSVFLNDKRVADEKGAVFDSLNRSVRGILLGETKDSQTAKESEAVLRFDEKLNYSHVTEAIRTISGYTN